MMLSGLALLLGCGRAPDVAPEPAEMETEGRFQYAATTPSEAPRPARFDADLPSSVEALGAWSDAYPPRAYVEARACAGDAAMLDQMQAAHRKGWTDGAELALGLAQTVQYCDGQARCSWAAQAWETAGTPGDKAFVGAMHIGCADGAEVMEDPAVPVEVVLEFHGGLFGPPSTVYSPRLGAVLRGLPPEPPFRARVAAIRHGELDDPRVAADLLAAAARVTHPSVLGGIMRGLGGQSDPKARARWTAWCAQADDAWVCEAPDARARGLDFAEADEAPSGPPSAQAQRLVALGLADEGLVGHDVWSIAEQGGVAFDTETGMWPNEHDALLATLWASAGGLPDAVFTETPPREPEDMRVLMDDEGHEVLAAPTEGEDVYRLVGYAGGKRWEVVAEDLGDWYDVSAVLGLLNTMARDLGTTTRFLTLETGDQMSAVLAGDEAALETAIDEGLLPVGDPGAAEDHGKDFERRALEAILRGELD